MKRKVVVLKESQVIKIIDELIVENRKRIYPIKNTLNQNRRDDKILQNAYHQFGIDNPYLLYRRLLKYQDELIDISGNPTEHFEISEIIRVLENYFDLEPPMSHDRSKRRDVGKSPDLETKYRDAELGKPKFSDRYKFKPSDLKKFGNE